MTRFRNLFESLRAFLLRIDPRFFVMTNHASLVTYGLIASCLQRSTVQIALCLGVGVGLELGLARLKYGRGQNIADGVKSGLVITLGLLVFLVSRHWWFYGVAAAIAILGKNFIRRENGSHAYNPTGLTILVMIAFFPNYVFVRGDQFNGTYIPFFSVLFWGSLAIWRANRWRATFTYLVVSVSTSLIYALSNVKFEFVRLFGADFGTEGMLFMFLMFTDPKTCPSNFRRQKYFGATLALLNVSFRAHEYAYSQFLALFITSSFLIPFLDFFEPRAVRLRIPTLPVRLKRAILVVLVALIPLSMTAALISHTEAWPLTDYAMFARRRDLKNTSMIRAAIKTENGFEFLKLNGRYPGYSYLLLSLLRENRQRDIARVVRYLYKIHRENGGVDSGRLVLVRRSWVVNSQEPKVTDEIVSEVKSEP